MPYRNKTFVSFDGDNDIHYYRLMRAWKENPSIPFNFFDAHDINTARDTSQEETIKRRLRERMLSARTFVLLIGSRTKYLYRFVRWEIEQALSQGLPIIGVNLNGRRQLDGDLCPPIIRDQLVIHISFGSTILRHALSDWPSQHDRLRMQNTRAPYHYPETVYNRLTTD